MVVEIFDIGVAGEEPDQLVDDRLEMQLLGSGERKTIGEVEAHLVAEHRERAGAGAVALLDAVAENVLDQVEILAHRFLASRNMVPQHGALSRAASLERMRPHGNRRNWP